MTDERRPQLHLAPSPPSPSQPPSHSSVPSTRVSVPSPAPRSGNTPLSIVVPPPPATPRSPPPPRPGFGDDDPEEHTAVSGDRSLERAIVAGAHVVRSRAYSFVLDEQQQPIELGSGRFAKAFLGVESWTESKTQFRREVAIKVLQRGVSQEDALRFHMEKELLERVQGHPNIIQLHASGEMDNPDFIPPSIRDRVENDYMILELCDLSLEERLKGARNRATRENLLRYDMRERLFRVLEYMLPVASAIEYAHLVRNVCHRDIKPANILLRTPNPRLRGDSMDIRLADFNVGKVRDEALDLSMTQAQGVPGTLFFQAPEQETNCFEILVNVQRGSREVTYFEDFFMYITQNDTFQIFNRPQRYPIAGADRAKSKIYLGRPFDEPSETNVRAKVIKSVDRPADIYSLGALFYYLVSGAFANPRSLYDAFHKFIEYDGSEDQNSVDAYIEHEYAVIQSLRAPRSGDERPTLAPADRFFSYKQYLDGNGELIDKDVMKIIGRSMIRNKPDSYCQAWDVHTEGISRFVDDLRGLYGTFGAFMPSRPGYLPNTVSWVLKAGDLWKRLVGRVWPARARKPPRGSAPPSLPPPT